jgi:hypothetical protein
MANGLPAGLMVYRMQPFFHIYGFPKETFKYLVVYKLSVGKNRWQNIYAPTYIL